MLTKKQENSLKRLFNKYRKNAEKRSLDFSLTLEEFSDLVLQKCYYCGVEPCTVFNRYIKKDGTRSADAFEYVSLQELRGYDIYTNGVDRYDNALGYSVSNCVPCCRICNRAKGVESIETWNTWLMNIVEYNKDWYEREEEKARFREHEPN